MEKKLQAVSLRMVKEAEVPYDTKTGLNSPIEVYKFLSNEYFDFGNLPEEKFCVICLDNKNKPVNVHMASHGSKTSSIVDIGDIFKRVLLSNAKNIIVAHNHPSGNTTPSNDDVFISKRLMEAGQLFGINLLDHIIIGDDEFYSLKENGRL